MNAVKLGAVDYLSKPVDADDVVAALLALYGRKAEAGKPHVGRSGAEHIQRIYGSGGRVFADLPAAQHAPSHAPTHPGQARAKIGRLVHRHLPAVVSPERWRKNSISQCNQNRIWALIVRIVGDLSMYPNEDAIFERLDDEQIGLLIRSPGEPGLGCVVADPQATVRGRTARPNTRVEHYAACMLKGLVNDRHIVVADQRSAD